MRGQELKVNSYVRRQWIEFSMIAYSGLIRFVLKSKAMNLQ
jgi:hypothetical protein